MNVMRAYPTLLRVGFAGALAYRAELIIWMLTTRRGSDLYKS
jgi:ABC-2 type transport system permease protein